MKLASDIDIAQTKRIFEVLREDSPSNMFEGVTSLEMETIASLFKVVSFKK